jgi:hypothetical protein
MEHGAARKTKNKTLKTKPRESKQNMEKRNNETLRAKQIRKNRKTK